MRNCFYSGLIINPDTLALEFTTIVRSPSLTVKVVLLSSLLAVPDKFPFCIKFVVRVTGFST